MTVDDTRTQRDDSFNSPAGTGGGLERRRSASDAERTTRLLHDAIGHLLWKRERGEYLDLASNEMAVESLCGAAQEVVRGERRQLIRTNALVWLRNIVWFNKR